MGHFFYEIRWKNMLTIAANKYVSSYLFSSLFIYSLTLLSIYSKPRAVSGSTTMAVNYETPYSTTCTVCQDRSTFISKVVQAKRSACNGRTESTRRCYSAMQCKQRPCCWFYVGATFPWESKLCGSTVKCKQMVACK